MTVAKVHQRLLGLLEASGKAPYSRFVAWPLQDRSRLADDLYTAWVDTVKTSCSNELPPQDPDWCVALVDADNDQLLISRQVLRPRRRRRAPHLPPQNRGYRSSSQGTRLDAEPRVAPEPPRRCIGLRRPPGAAESGEDRSAGDRRGEGRPPHHAGWTAGS